ncbi:hypothetical protein [Cytophaga aurantiaca]|uniref:hypothetical protein n=1 Tax=Cytophaga aurantiaca TaxID=29530 RepID=UPI00037A513C|nr:hypothetical protein [Cytophaga aurantiaca]
MKVFFATVLFLCSSLSYAQNDSTVFFIERDGVFEWTFVLSTDFKIYALSKCDMVKNNSYQEIKIKWIKVPKTEFTRAGYRIDTSDIKGAFLIGANFPLPNHFYVYENRDYLFECNNNYLYPGKVFVLESYIHKWKGADYIDLSSTGTVSDGLTRIDLKTRNQPIITITGSIPRVVLEGDFNGDFHSDFVLIQGDVYKMYVSNNGSFTRIRCKMMFGDIVPEF